MVTPSVLEHDDNLAGRCKLSVIKGHLRSSPERAEGALTALRIQPSSIPLEPTAGTVTLYDGFSIVPLPAVAKSMADLHNNLKSVRNKLERLKQLTPEARSQAKYKRSIEWLWNNVQDRLRETDSH